MKRKYIEERLGGWFVHGEHPDGWVDIEDASGTVLTRIPKDEANKICVDRDRLIDVIEEMAIAFDDAAPEAFLAHWYAPQRRGF